MTNMEYAGIFGGVREATGDEADAGYGVPCTRHKKTS